MVKPTAKAVSFSVPTVKTVYLGDTHAPFHDVRAVGLMTEFLKEFKPAYLFLIGDLVDFYAISRFDKDPERLMCLQDELDETVAMLATFRRQVPKAKIIFREGNHEARLTRYLWSKPEIAKLRSLQLSELLEFRNLKIEYSPYASTYSHYGMSIEHGHKVNKFSCYTAKAMLEQRGRSGICGHTHRLGVYHYADDTGWKSWYENGCLCRFDQQYLHGQPNWQHGCTVSYHAKNGRTFLQQIEIHEGSFLHEGKLWLWCR